jgi:hypothetical protein
MLSLPNGNFILNDFTEGWDLILLSPEFEELERLEGTNDLLPGYYRAIKTRTSEDEKFILWMRGKSDLSIVSTESFSARHIHNFWNYRGKDCNAIAVAVDNKASAIVGLGMLQGEV